MISNRPLAVAGLSTAPSPLQHRPVMLREVLACIAPAALPANDTGTTVIMDATFGRGGYSVAIFDMVRDVQIIAFDRDPAAVAAARVSMAKFDQHFSIHQACFSQLPELYPHWFTAQQPQVDPCAQQAQGLGAAVFDLGLSSPQLDDASRGFSFNQDGPLDMRFAGKGTTAAEWLASADTAAIAAILREYGDEKRSRQIAAAITRMRTRSPITTTGKLREIIHSCIGSRSGRIDSATRSFQALRIHINQEYQRLRQGLHAAMSALLPGGRLVVVSYHSGEDRITKQIFAAACGKEQQVLPPKLPQVPSNPDKQHAAPAGEFRTLFRQVCRPTSAEIADNPRARSARLRAIVKHPDTEKAA